MKPARNLGKQESLAEKNLLELQNMHNVKAKQVRRYKEHEQRMKTMNSFHM